MILKVLNLTFFFMFSFQLFTQIPIDGLVANYTFDNNAIDSSDNKNVGIVVAQFTNDRFHTTAHAIGFNGINEYVEFSDIDDLSISETGYLSISVWIKCSTLNFNKNQGNGYVHWMGKGFTGQHEWAFRIYNLDSPRPNRISCYAFNLSGGYGSGSYSQEPINTDEWMHFVGLYNTDNNLIQLYKNGILSDTDHFSDNSIYPKNGVAKFRIGTRDFKSFFKGAIDDIRIYNRILSKSEINKLYHEKGWMIESKSNSTLSNSIVIYPNPVSKRLIVNLSANYCSGKHKIRIINFNGQIVQENDVSKNITEIKISKSNLVGSHLVQLINENNIVLFSKKIIFY